MPLNNKLLLDANMTFFRYNPAFGFPPPDGITNLIPVTEQSSALACTNANRALRHPGCTAENAATLRWAPAANYAYRGLEQWGYAEGATNSYNAGASYVTGSHNIRVGYQNYWLRQLDETIAAGEPARLPLQPGRAQSGDLPASDAEQQHDHQLHGIFIQDQYTRDRLTLSGAVRWDRASSYAPVEGNGVSETSFLNPAPITFEKTAGVDAYNDISPRVGRRLRRVRQRQDGAEVPLGQVPGLCLERSAVHVHEQGGHDRRDGQPRLDGQRRRQGRGLRPAEQRGAGPGERGQVDTCAARDRATTPTSARPARRPSSIRTSSRAGACAPTTTRPRSRCSRKCCRAYRRRSATSTARSTASW